MACSSAWRSSSDGIAMPLSYKMFSSRIEFSTQKRTAPRTSRRTTSAAPTTERAVPAATSSPESASAKLRQRFNDGHNTEKEKMRTRASKTWIYALIVGTCAAAATGTPYARDRGVNQPGAVGNTGPAVGRDPGVNQPGAVGNKEAEAVRDPGKNQPGAAGNVGAEGVKDRGVNQPGAPGNRAGVRR
jgi:hypothetical protein